jgi:Na+/glutamate symporter
MRRRLNDKPDSGGGGYVPAVVAMKTGVIGGGIGAAQLIKKKDERDAEQKDRSQRDADAEMKRESRGVKMPANFGILEEAKQDAKDSATAKKQDKAYNESLTTENKAKGGMVSASRRADGCCTKGKTRGKMV